MRERFEFASAPYLAQPWAWWFWAIVLAGAAFATPWVGAPNRILFLWSATILIGGAFEMTVARRSGAPLKAGPVAGWAFRLQANLSAVGVALSVALVIAGQSNLLPGLWLLLLGHSFYGLGGLAFRPLKVFGLAYQLGGFVALWPSQPLPIFAATLLIANGGLGIAILRRRRNL